MLWIQNEGEKGGLKQDWAFVMFGFGLHWFHMTKEERLRGTIRAAMLGERERDVGGGDEENDSRYGIQIKASVTTGILN